jgi:digeranylgeranylglycerophospholipid reductase
MISVVGGGPAGCIAAKYCAREHDTVLFEPQKRDERRVQCSGLLSRSGLKLLDIDPSSGSAKSFIQNSVRGAKVYSSRGGLLLVDGGADKAYVTDRRAFDNLLLDEALSAGAVLKNETIDKKNIGDIRSRSERIILATGTNYNLHKNLNINAPCEFVYGAQYEMKVECDPDYVEMYLNVPGFFSWIIPVDDHARVGLCSLDNPVPHMDDFIKKLQKNKRLKDPQIRAKNYGIIPMYNPRLRTEFPKISLVGDAAGHVKATTGGGVILGGLAARNAGAIGYERLWRKEIGKELYLHLRVRRFLNNLSDRNTDKLIRLLAENRDLIERKGDMDMASHLLKGFIGRPAFMAKFILQAPAHLLDQI